MSKFRSLSVRSASGRLLAAVLSVMLALSFPALGSQETPELPAADGSSYTPEIMVTMLDGKEMKLSSLRGKVVLLDFFWTKCPHCQDHAPHVVDLYKKYQSRGVTVLGLATDFQNTNDLKTATKDVNNFVKQYKLNYPVGFSSIELIAYFTDSHNRGVPQMVLFGTDGKMILRKVGWSDQYNKEFEAAIEGQLGKAGISAPAPNENAEPATIKPGSKGIVRNKPGKVSRV